MRRNKTVRDINECAGVYVLDTETQWSEEAKPNRLTEHPG